MLKKIDHKVLGLLLFRNAFFTVFVSYFRLRFHENPSFEKITKNRCSGPWINGFSSFGAWNFTGCLEFYLGLCKKVHAPAKKEKPIFFAKKPC